MVITGGDLNMQCILDLTLRSKQLYTSKHGYDLLIKKNWNSIGKHHFKQHETELLGYAKPGMAIWGFMRVVWAFEMLRDYDAVMWIDADSIITNSEYTISDFVTEDHCLFVSHDWSTKSSFSTGNFIVKRHKFVHTMYSLFLDFSKHFIGDKCQEQVTLNYLYQKSIEVRNHTKMLSTKYLNSVPIEAQQTKTWAGRADICDPWTTDSFLAHLTGITHDERKEILNSSCFIDKI